MANIAITTNCNLRCKYCFADEFVGNKRGDEMSFENYITAKNFILKSGKTEFGIIGGEPSIHNQYKKILRDCIDDTRITHVTIFTNGIKVKEFLSEYACGKFSFLINCNSPADIGEDKYAELVENIRVLAEDYSARDRITLGINLYKPEQDFSYIVDLCKQMKKSDLRVSVTIPQYKIDMNQYFQTMKPLLISFYKALTQEHIKPKYDCNILPSCIYSDTELFELAKLLSDCGPERSRLIGEGCMCRPVVDIMPDLSAIRCFGMSEQCKIAIKDFRNLQDVSNYFIREIDFRLANKPLGNACDDCYKRKTLQCSGGCLSFRT